MLHSCRFQDRSLRVVGCLEVCVYKYSLSCGLDVFVHICQDVSRSACALAQNHGDVLFETVNHVKKDKFPSVHHYLHNRDA